MSERNWYVASVRSCQERKVAEKLSSPQVETYVPVQKVRRQWSDRIKTVDRLLLPGLVFIRCTGEERAAVFGKVYGIVFFMMDRTLKVPGPLVIPDRQMEDFMKVVRAYSGDGDLTVAEQGIAGGDTVRVIRGPLKDFVCECVEIQNRRRLIIRLGSIGSVLATISASDVVKV